MYPKIILLFKRKGLKVVTLGNPSKLRGVQLHVLKQKLKKKHHLKGTYKSNQTNIKIQKITTYIFSNFDVCSIAFVMYLLQQMVFPF